MSFAWLPPVLAEIAEITGIDAALALAEHAGGLRRYCPTPDRLDDAHWLVAACGREAAALVAQRFGGTMLEIPLGPAGNNRKLAKRIRDMIAAGASSNDIAQATGVAFRTVTRHRARLRDGDDDAQGTLL